MKMVFETERLLIGRFREEDAEPLRSMESAPDVLRYVVSKICG